MPSRQSGYQQLPQNEDADSPPESPTLQRQRRHPGRIDLTNLDNAFKRWTESIANKVKRKKKVKDYSRKIIWKSVFEPQIPHQEPTLDPTKSLNHKPPMTQGEFDALVATIRAAISEGIHPKMITKGSSGSYFARAKNEVGKVQTIAVFKPKDEEPYGRLNPKTTKWLHRQLRFIIPFGRACLIPNLRQVFDNQHGDNFSQKEFETSYISEAAASLLDSRLDLGIVPPTQLVSLSSPAFFYDWIHRTAAKKGKPLPDKIGSLQYFLHGYQDASDFLRKHPWPGRSITDTFDQSNHRHRSITKRVLNTLKIVCGKTGAEDLYDEDYDDDDRLFDASEASEGQSPFYWSQGLQQSFREELEKLVILDFLMRNTDRGADNYMIKYCEGHHEKSLVDVAPTRSAKLEMPLMSEMRTSQSPQIPRSPRPLASTSTNFAGPEYTRAPHIHIAAIDNSLSFPHMHPQGWRNYTYGWLYLPVSIVGRPFSDATRNHFLPLLTSKSWWEETTFQLEKLFALDPDFHPKMFRRQMAVIKGQAFNIVQSLKHADEGPLELTRRTKALVWNDELEVSMEVLESSFDEPISSPRSIQLPLPRRRSSSGASDFPPPMRRTSTDTSGFPRPVPFAKKFQRIHPGTTGVTMLEHLERLDAVEASLQRLGVDEDAEEETDVGESSTQANKGVTHQAPASEPLSPSDGQNLLVGTPLPTVEESQEGHTSDASSIAEEDLVTMSKSTSFADSQRHGRFSSQAESPGVDWIQTGELSGVKRTVVVERLELIHKKALCAC